MLPEAELFVMAEMMTVEVLGRMGPEDRHVVVPSWSTTPGAGGPASLRRLMERAVEDDVRVPLLLAGDRVGSHAEPAAVVDDDRYARLAVASRTAIDAAQRAVDGNAVVHAAEGDLSTHDFLARATVTRSLLAHYVAAYLGSTACPLPEELARPLWELTEPDAARWRALGFFGQPRPLPDHVSWRDRFLLSAGHPPHPLGH